LLGLLARGPASGYDLLRAFDTSLALVWPATQSQLYRELGRLADDGLVEVGPPGRRGRREYTLTAAGHQELTRWLMESELVPAQRSPALLRVFLLWNLPADAARAYLERLAARSRAFHERLSALAVAADSQAAGDDFDRYARVVLEHGIRTSAAQAQWAAWAVGELAPAEEENEVPPGPADRPARRVRRGTRPAAGSPARRAR